MGFVDIFGAMDLKRFWVFFVLVCGLWVACFCNQDGFLSLSCGGTSSYTDSSNISWVSDDPYVALGIASTIHQIEGTSSSTIPIRVFLNSLGRKCYRLPVKNLSSAVLVRAEFVYKNYDRLSKPPTFSVSLGTAITSTVNLTAKDPWIEEFVWSVNKDTILFCLNSIRDGGSPVISSLEVRPLPVGAYRHGITDLSSKVLRKCYRINCGHTNGTLRYPFDPYDRIWDADSNFAPFHVSSGFVTQLDFNASSVTENPPLAVLRSVRVLARKNVLTYDFPFDTIGDFYIVLYFAGVLRASSFGVIVNGDIMESGYIVNSSEIGALYYTRKRVKSLNITLQSINFHPQISGIEVYEIVDVPAEVSSTTVSALGVIQQSAGLDLGWQDDPCSPTAWDHIRCEGNTVTSLKLSDINLRSISPTFGDLLDLKNLDLHNTSLYGLIQDLGSLQHLKKLNLSFNHLTSFGENLENLVGLQILDLQNNSLLGTVPDSLGKLKDLHLLNLENNRLQGSLPDSLNRESLVVRTSGNLCLSFSTTCNDVNDSSNSSIETPQVTIVTQKKQTGHSHSRIGIVIGSIAGALLAVLFIGISVFLYTRKNTTEVIYTSRSVEFDMRNWNAAKVFTYREIKSATNHFKIVLGRGSFGSVYLGKLPDGKLVAVKVRFDRTQLGAESFINEVHLLSRIRHQNLVCLEGFCNEAKQQILVYEYLPGGSLADHLYGSNSKKVSLSWVRRLKIAVDAAKGLDYLHNGSDPRIIHRDVKCGNILLDSEMNAKVCDFGLSKQMIQADASHVTTVVKGTAGYLDPEYYSTQQLTEKSDIYSFGVVLLELICGREPLRHYGSPDSFNLVLWAKPYLQAGAFEIVVDESMTGSFDSESLKKTAAVAVRSVERDAAERPSIAQVLAELKEAYTLQLSFLANGNVN